MLSIIIPFHNEQDNLKILYQELKDVLKNIDQDHEIIFINDGSTDKSELEAEELLQKDKNIIFLNHRKKSGKGKALATGLDNARGETIILLDADLQDNPVYLPQFLKKIEDGYEFINGVRIDRKDNAIIKIYTNISNKLLRYILKSPFSDINCGFKVFKKSVIKEAVLYGNNFRFLPLAAYHNGFKVTEVKVNNRPRIHGKSKYGINKLFIGLADFVTANFLFRFSERPLHFFGIIGGTLFSIGFIIAFVLSIQRLFFGVLLYQRPILFLAILLIMVGIQIVMTGIIGELIVYVNKKKT